MWMFKTVNYYGGQVWVHPDGWRAIQCWTASYRHRGFSVSDENGKHWGYVWSVEDLP